MDIRLIKNPRNKKYLEIIGIITYKEQMMNETNTPQPSRTLHPPRGATTKELHNYIQTRKKERNAERRYYYLENYLAEAPPLSRKEALKHDYVTESFSTQIEYLQNTIQFLMLNQGEDKLKTALHLQRRFCETIHLLHKMKIDNHKIRNSTRIPKGT